MANDLDTQTSASSQSFIVCADISELRDKDHRRLSLFVRKGNPLHLIFDFNLYSVLLHSQLNLDQIYQPSPGSHWAMSHPPGCQSPSKFWRRKLGLLKAGATTRFLPSLSRYLGSASRIDNTTRFPSQLHNHNMVETKYKIPGGHRFFGFGSPRARASDSRFLRPLRGPKLPKR